MKLEELVPDLELCKRIPDGEFEDSAFCWRWVWQTGFICRESGCQQHSGWVWQIEKCNAGRFQRCRARGEQIFPAPTLEEILKKLKISTICGVEHHGDFFVSNRHVGCFVEKAGANTALKLWMKLKGIEE